MRWHCVQVSDRVSVIMDLRSLRDSNVLESGVDLEL
jgi:hypothetical protein